MSEKFSSGTKNPQTNKLTKDPISFLTCFLQKKQIQENWQFNRYTQIIFLRMLEERNWSTS